MTGPAGSIATGSAAALFIAALFSNDTFLIAVFGGIGGLSRWLYFALNGASEPWYKGVGHLALSVFFVTGIFPIAQPILGLVFNGSSFMDDIALEPNANLGIAYFIGMFTTVLIGWVEDRMKSKQKGDSNE